MQTSILNWKEGSKMDRAAGNEHTIITDRQVWALMGLMDAFYRVPKNRAAYEQWKAARVTQNAERGDAK